ncbi:MAG: helix-turn-helix transcriptional regulator [Vallitaleaceae bacterium]|jgi:transcriptional regulator with XRE-family HTH domain|nr:helix-turn-helix transcriptional regulator [Vallitaleaceae bacterium]
MNNLGNFLKLQRESRNLSLKDLQIETLITDTRINRIERGLVKEPSPEVLRILAEYYELSIIDLYIKAGYLTDNSICKEQRAFYDVDQLSENDFEHIQTQIDYLIKHKTNNGKRYNDEV